jgi:hypothetical protein
LINEINGTTKQTRLFLALARENISDAILVFPAPVGADNTTFCLLAIASRSCSIALV